MITEEAYQMVRLGLSLSLKMNLSLATLVPKKSGACGSVILLAAVVFRGLNGRYVPEADG